MSSRKHAETQIRALIEDVQERVFRNSGVMLEREVIYLEEF